MIDIKYGILFTVELMHKYFADGNCDDFTVTPSHRTQKVLGGNNILAKQYDNILYVGLPSMLNVNKPADALPQNMQLTFFMQLNTPLFFNYTNMPFKWPAGKLYYFTNRVNNKANGKKFLSQVIGYNNAKAYAPGDVAADAAGLVFQSIKSGTGVTPAVANADNWAAIDNNQYVNEQDALQWMPSISTYAFTTPQNAVTVDVWGYNTGTKDYSASVLSFKKGFLSPANSFTLDLSILQPGKYKLRVNGAESWIYINDELSGKQVFAVVDIFNDSSVDTDYQFVSGSGEFASPVYTIYFLNRYTIWKYVLASGAAGTVTDPLGKYSFAPPAGGAVLSTKPIPLSQQPLKFSLAVNTSNFAPIANASPQRLVQYKAVTDTYSCSEIFLNH